MRNVIIAGKGNMAQLFTTKLQHMTYDVYNFEHLPDGYVAGLDSSETVGLHVGSGKDLDRFVARCADLEIPVLQGSTGQKIDEAWPGLVVNADNFALPILRVIQLLSKIAGSLGPSQGLNMKAGLAESHQWSKKSVPGTAKRMAAAIGVEESDIKSVRDPDLQMAMGVPADALDAHGHHFLTWTGFGVQIQLTTRINGRGAYFEGGLHLLQILHDRRHERGVHDVLDFLDRK
ncbi:MAG: hypothetical protein KGI45_00265 [Patescibacteria group bacterium]|nr:hypothetical protein [Patescibacteria group bacterium]MDE1966497.1 hypothetical protein [Patescibacteria group bacterium]